MEIKIVISTSSGGLNETIDGKVFSTYQLVKCQFRERETKGSPFTPWLQALQRRPMALKMQRRPGPGSGLGPGPASLSSCTPSPPHSRLLCTSPIPRRRQTVCPGLCTGCALWNVLPLGLSLPESLVHRLLLPRGPPCPPCLQTAPPPATLLFSISTPSLLVDLFIVCVPHWRVSSHEGWAYLGGF